MYWAKYLQVVVLGEKILWLDQHEKEQMLKQNKTQEVSGLDVAGLQSMALICNRAMASVSAYGEVLAQTQKVVLEWPLK